MEDWLSLWCHRDLGRGGTREHLPRKALREELLCQKVPDPPPNVDFSAPTFYELFDAKNDTWLMTNLHATADAGTKTALHADLHAWYGCVGATCP